MSVTQVSPISSSLVCSSRPNVRPHPPALILAPGPVGCRPCWASFPCAPDPWIALRVEDRDQEYRLRFHPIEQAAREPSKQGPSDTPMHQGKLLGVRDCRVQPLPHGRQELLAESSSRPFVLVVGVFDIAGRFRTDDNVAGHRSVVRSRTTISSQGMPVAASRSTLSSRRSSSARCGGVKGIECGVSARLSHSRSTRRSRSSSERRPMSICGVAMAIVSHRPLVPASTSVNANVRRYPPAPTISPAPVGCRPCWVIVRRLLACFVTVGPVDGEFARSAAGHSIDIAIVCDNIAFRWQRLR